MYCPVAQGEYLAHNNNTPPPTADTANSQTQPTLGLHQLTIAAEEVGIQLGLFQADNSTNAMLPPSLGDSLPSHSSYSMHALNGLIPTSILAPSTPSADSSISAGKRKSTTSAVSESGLHKWSHPLSAAAQAQ